LFEDIMRQRLDRLGTSAGFVLSCNEEEAKLARLLQHLLRARPTCILIASTAASAGPEDVVGRAMLKAGCSIERFLASRAGQSAAARLQGRDPGSFRAGLLPFRQSQRGRFDSALDVGPLSHLRMRDRQSRGMAGCWRKSPDILKLYLWRTLERAAFTLA
jgi:hypothetical protein